MKLVTLKRKEILDTISLTGEYIPNPVYNFMPDKYSEMFEEYAKHTGIKISAAIWAWHTAAYKRADCISDIKLENVLIKDFGSTFLNNLKMPSNLLGVKFLNAYNNELKRDLNLIDINDEDEEKNEDDENEKY